MSRATFMRHFQDTPRATRDALVYTCKHLNLDLDETTCAVPYRGWGMDCFVVLILFGVLLSKSSLEIGIGRA
jgi:hypothetical protein